MNTGKGQGTQSIFAPLFIYLGIEMITLMLSAVIENSLYVFMIDASIGILIFGYLFRKDHKMDGTVYTKVKTLEYFWPVILGISACLVNNNLVYLSGMVQITPELEEVMSLFYQGNIPLELFILGILTPLSEELLFRGLIYKRARRLTTVKWAAIMASSIFAMVHGSMIQGLYAFLSGLLLCYVYERYQSFLAPLFFHMAANVISVIASETGILGFMFTGRVVFLAVTFAIAVILVLAVYLIEVRVHVREVVEDGTGETKEKVDLL